MTNKSAREKRTAATTLFAKPLTDKQRRELQRLARKPDHQIDYSDGSEKHPLPTEVHIGKFHRPIK